MATNRDYIPHADAEFALWFDNLGRQVGLHTAGSPPDWTQHSAEDKNGLMASYGRWQMAFQEAQNDLTKTPAPTPDAGPDSKTHASPASPGVVEVSYLGAKPYGVERIEAAYAVADEPIADFALLTERDTFSHNWSIVARGAGRFFFGAPDGLGGSAFLGCLRFCGFVLEVAEGFGLPD